MNYFNRVALHVESDLAKYPTYLDTEATANVRKKAQKRYQPRGKAFERMRKLSKTTEW